MKAGAGRGHAASRQTTARAVSRKDRFVILLLLLAVGLFLRRIGWGLLALARGLLLWVFGRLADLDRHRDAGAAALFPLQPHAHGLADRQFDAFFTPLDSDHGVVAELDIDGGRLLVLLRGLGEQGEALAVVRQRLDGPDEGRSACDPRQGV